MKQRFSSLYKAGAVTLACLLAIPLFPVPAFGLFGLGDIVFDPTSYATLGSIMTSNASMVTKMIEEYNQMVKIYTTNLNMYNHAMAMAQRFTNLQKLNWMTLAQTGVNDYTKSQYGETIAWPQMMNGHPALAPQAWTNATLAVDKNPNLTSDLVGSSSRLAGLASIEAVDGSAAKCLATVAQYRADGQVNTKAFQSLQSAQVDGSDATNSEIQQLNLINASQAQAMNEQRSQGAIHACLVEQQTLANKVQRDSIADHMNFLTHAQQYVASENSSWGNAAQAIQSR